MSWRVGHDSEPPRPDAERESDRLLLSAIDSVVEKLPSVADQEGAHSISERALTLRDIILDWHHSDASAAERDDITNKVLGLHVALSRLQRAEH